MDKTKRILTGILSLSVPFSYSLYYVIMMMIGNEPTSSGLRLFCATLFLLTIIALLGYRYFDYDDVVLFFLVLILAFLIFITRFFYSGDNSLYNGSFLSFCVRAVPSMFLAKKICVDDNYRYYARSTQVFVIIYTIATFMASFNRRFSILVYQSISYYAVFAFGITSFLFINHEELQKEDMVIIKGRYINVLYIFLMILQVFSMIAGGGRGAFVLIIIYSFYFLVSIIKAGRKGVSFFAIILIIIVVFSLFDIKDHLSLDSFFTGFDRINSFFGNRNFEEDQRAHIYTEAAKVYLEYPVFGGGIGSVYYRLGSYSHNMFLDILIDTGLIGLLAFIILLFRFIRKSYYLIKASWKNHLPIIMFLSSFIFLMFSGNVLNDGCLWFGFVYIYFRYKGCIYDKSLLYPDESL